MNHADPWDEIPRLEKQMEAELLSQLEARLPAVPRVEERVGETSVPPAEE